MQTTTAHLKCEKSNTIDSSRTPIVGGTFRCWLGTGFVGFSEGGVCYLAFGDQSAELERDFHTRFKLPPDWPLLDLSQLESVDLKAAADKSSPASSLLLTQQGMSGQALETLQAWYIQIKRVVDRYAGAEGIAEDIDRLIDSIPLEVAGTPFQRQVWQTLASIPWGSTISYRQLAQRIGKPRAMRAVAAACGANPIAILIPCHRVIGSNQSMTGYRWGIERKKSLLKRERTA